MKKYKVVDMTNGKETVGYADTISGVKKLAKYWCENVLDGAYIYYYPLNETTGKYRFSERKFLETY